MLKKNVILGSVAGVVLLGALTSANAVPAPPAGWYVEANIGNSKISNVTYATGNSVSGSGRGWNVNGGYKFMPYFATELGYTKYADAKGKISGTTIADDSHYAYDIAAKGILPIGESGADLFSKLGVARLKSHVTAQNSSFIAANGITVNTGSHTATGVYFGLGGEYTAWQALAVNAQWQYAKGNSKTGNYQLYSLGVSYTFA